VPSITFPELLEIFNSNLTEMTYFLEVVPTHLPTFNYTTDAVEFRKEFNQYLNACLFYLCFLKTTNENHDQNH
jgi:hypothetical protein